MSVWRPDSVEVEPNTKLIHWSVKEVTDEGLSTIHFVGYDWFSGRVSSPVQTYDPDTRVGVTRSGRHYELVGKPGLNLDAQYVFGIWIQQYTDPKVVDVSENYL